MIKKINITKIENKNKIKKRDLVANEVPFNIFINKKLYITLMASPENLEELGLGFLFSEGIISNFEDIDSFFRIGNGYCFKLKNKFLLKNKKKESIILSGCGKSSISASQIEFKKLNYIKNNLKINNDIIFNLMKEFIFQSEVFFKTGCVHRVSFSDNGKFIFGFDDIGRHNALDKNIGYSLKNKISLENKALFSTGRISSDLVYKANKIKVPLIISRTAPTSLAIEMAKKSNMQIIGFVRGNKMNIY